MVNKDLLQKLGIKINPDYKSEVDDMSTKEVIKKTIEHTYKRGRIRNYFVIGLGCALSADGFADCGVEVLERIYSVTTNRNFDIFSILELLAGVGMVYFGVKSKNKKDAIIKSLATSLNENCVQD